MNSPFASDLDKADFLLDECEEQLGLADALEARGFDLASHGAYLLAIRRMREAKECLAKAAGDSLKPLRLRKEWSP